MEARRTWLVILTIALIFRVLALQTRAFDFDECYELDHLSLSPFELIRHGDGFPPLYRWLLSLFCFVFGETSARWFSVLVGMGTVVAIVFLARCVAGEFVDRSEAELVGYRAGLFAALSPHQILFSQQARGYILFVFIAAIVCWIAWELSHRPTRRLWFLLVTGCTLGFATHYYFCLLIVQVWIWVAISLRASQARNIAIFAGLQSLMCAPILYALSIDLAHELPAEAINRVDWTGLFYAGFTLFSGWTLGPSSIALQTLPLQESLSRIGPWAIFVFAMVASLSVYGVKGLPPRSYVPILASCILTPLAAAAIAIALSSSFAARYVVWLAIPIAVWLGLCATFRGRTLRTTASWCLVGVFLLANWNRVYDRHYKMDDAFELRKWIASNAREMPVLVLSHYFASSVERAFSDSKLTDSQSDANSSNSHHRAITALSFASDEPHDWGKVLPKFLHEELTSQGKTEYLVVARWLDPDNLLIDKRDAILSLSGAKKVATVSNNIEIYQASRNDLENWIQKVLLSNDSPSVGFASFNALMNGRVSLVDTCAFGFKAN